MAGGVGKAIEKFLVEDYPYTCVIESSINIKSHTEYAVRVSSQYSPKEDNWVTSKRYSDFTTLCDTLKSHNIDLSLSLPPKKVFGRMNDEFVAERLRGLQTFLDLVLSLPWLYSSIEFKSFLTSSPFSNLSCEEVAFQNVTMLLRSESRWEIVQTLPNIGWRRKKCYFLCRDKNNPKQKYIISWVGLNERCKLDAGDIEKALKVLTSLQHPYISPALFATSNNSCIVVIRTMYESGSVRDSLCSVSKPSDDYLKKYAASNLTHRTFSLSDIRLYGRQVLETLSTLRAREFPFVHIHAGNLALVDGRVQLLDVENCFTGLTSLYHHNYVKLRKIKTVEFVEVYCFVMCIDIDKSLTSTLDEEMDTVESLEVYCFGHLLYEMVTGVRLAAHTCDTRPVGCSADLWSVLESILSSDACKNGLPSLSSLLQHTLFNSDSRQMSLNGVHCKLGSRLKEACTAHTHNYELLVQHEQRRYHQNQCLTKAHAFHMSAEEKEKRRLRKVQSLNETQQNAESSNVVEIRESGSTAASRPTSDGGVKSIPMAPAPPPPPPPSGGSQTPRSDQAAPQPEGRSALLSSICSFDKMALKKHQ